MDQHEIEWRAEFDRLGEQQVYDNVKQGAIFNDERKRQAAFRWLQEQAAKHREREESTYWYVRWTFFAAIAAAIIGLIGAAISLLH